MCLEHVKLLTCTLSKSAQRCGSTHSSGIVCRCTDWCLILLSKSNLQVWPAASQRPFRLTFAIRKVAADWNPGCCLWTVSHCTKCTFRLNANQKLRWIDTIIYTYTYHWWSLATSLTMAEIVWFFAMLNKLKIAYKKSLEISKCCVFFIRPKYHGLWNVAPSCKHIITHCHQREYFTTMTSYRVV